MKEKWKNVRSTDYVHRVMGCCQKRYGSTACHDFLSGVLANSQLPRVLHQSSRITDNKDGSEVKSGVLHCYPSIYLTNQYFFSFQGFGVLSP